MTASITLPVVVLLKVPRQFASSSSCSSIENIGVAAVLRHLVDHKSITEGFLLYKCQRLMVDDDDSG